MLCTYRPPPAGTAVVRRGDWWLTVKVGVSLVQSRRWAWRRRSWQPRERWDSSACRWHGAHRGTRQRAQVLEVEEPMASSGSRRGHLDDCRFVQSEVEGAATRGDAVAQAGSGAEWHGDARVGHHESD